jgi:hypothetical protein
MFRTVTFNDQRPITPPTPTQKDNFHKFIFVLTKEHFSDCIFCATKGGGGWRGPLKVFPIKVSNWSFDQLIGGASRQGINRRGVGAMVS